MSFASTLSSRAVMYSRIWANSSLPPGAAYPGKDSCVRISQRSRPSCHLANDSSPTNTASLSIRNGMRRSFSMTVNRAPNWKSTASVHSSRLDEAVCSHRSRRKFNNPVSLDEKAPTLSCAERRTVRSQSVVCRLSIWVAAGPSFQLAVEALVSIPPVSQ